MNNSLLLSSILIAITGIVIITRTMKKKKVLFETGCVCGKFYPLHKGHEYLIQTAMRMSKKCTIIVCWKATENVTGIQRGEWVKKIFPEAEVLVKEDIYNDDGNSELWAKVTREWLGYSPQAVFTSESYGDGWAKYLNATHILVDQQRNTIPISGTKVRSNPLEYYHFLNPIVASYYSIVICIVGAESTGKTVLSNRLAMRYFGTSSSLVLEYGREVTERNLNTRNIVKEGNNFKTPEWRREDFIEIANEQQRRIDQACLKSKLVISDTNALSTMIWEERYMKTSSKEVIECFEKSRKVDLYLLLDVDGIPFVQDGTRDGEDQWRNWMDERFKQELKGNENVVILTGSFEDRYLQAMKEIECRYPALNKN